MSIKIKPGLYVICDPSYVLSNENYDKLLELESISDYGYDLSIHKDGKELFCKSLSTANGDGLYEVFLNGHNTTANLLSNMVNLPVDSGMIAITSIELVENLNLKEELSDEECCLIYIEILEESSVYKIAGSLHFANIVVETDFHDDYDDDDDNYWIETDDENDDFLNNY